MNHRTLGEYIHELRIEKGLTLTKLAAALDIDQSTLCKIENNKRQLSKEILPILSEIFNLDIHELRREYYSDIIAEMIYEQDDTLNLLKMVEEKTLMLRNKNSISL